MASKWDNLIDVWCDRVDTHGLWWHAIETIVSLPPPKVIHSKAPHIDLANHATWVEFFAK